MERPVIAKRMELQEVEIDSGKRTGTSTADAVYPKLGLSSSGTYFIGIGACVSSPFHCAQRRNQLRPHDPLATRILRIVSHGSTCG